MITFLTYYISYHIIVCNVRFGCQKCYLIFTKTKLERCGIDLQSAREKSLIITNSSNANCLDPLNEWKKIIPSFKDFGISGIAIMYHDSTMEKMGFKKSESLLRRILSSYRGACYSLTLPLELRKKSIVYVAFDIERQKTFRRYFQDLQLENVYFIMLFFYRKV